MVRRATASSVALWIATKEHCVVRARVCSVDGSEVASARADTIALGEHLHVAVVVVPGPFDWGRCYTYGLHLNDRALNQPGVLAPSARRANQLLSYREVSPQAPALPSFVLPAPDLNDVRLVHASCRMLQGQGDDALVGLDQMICRAYAEQPTARPQQVFFTGDQIYADYAPAELAEYINDLATALLGWSTPGPSDHAHSLGQFYVNYLLAWSDVLWPAHVSGRLAATKRGLRRVRRALANTSSLMTFDDHEVTDDWYLTREWTEAALAGERRRLIVNGLCAYAMFQGWGNTPQQFEPGQPGAELAAALANWRGDDDDTHLCRLLGIPSVSDFAAHTPPQLKPGPGAIAWHYRVEGPAYDVVALDTRTWRSFPGDAPDAPPTIISRAGLDQQIGSGPALRQPLTIVISSAVVVNLPRAWYGRALLWANYRLKAIRYGQPRGYAEVYGPDRGDWWSERPGSVGDLLSALAAKADHRARVILLSGDMHVGAAARIQHWDNLGERPATLVAAQLLSSPLKHETRATRLAQRTGFRIIAGPPSLRVRDPGRAFRVDFMRAHDRTEIVGRNHIAELTFSWAAEHKHVDQTLWWQPGKRGALAPRSRFRVPLDFDDPDYPIVQPA